MFVLFAGLVFVAFVNVVASSFMIFFTGVSFTDAVYLECSAPSSLLSWHSWP